MFIQFVYLAKMFMPKRGLYLIKCFSVIEVNLETEALGADDQYPSEVYFRRACTGALKTTLGAYLPHCSVQTFP